MNQTQGSKKLLKISYDQLSPETLEAVIAEFVARDATDYGESEVPFERKIQQVKKQLQSDKAIIIFDESTQTCNIVLKSDPLLRTLEI
ncbi:MAG: YheU family protein [Deltaproteobacteria bacterium]|nr:YheU family protein [Deltaproteobacteria bacterium]